jgi:hypothetical protein
VEERGDGERKGMEKKEHIIKLNNGLAIKSNVHLPSERVSDT